MKYPRFVAILVGAALIHGCSTTNSIPYKASTNNVISLQNTFKLSSQKVSLGSFTLAQGVQEELMCRMMGPVNISPGKSLASYIKEAFQEELFLAQGYDANSSTKINGIIERLSFSSVSPANWEISMRVSSDKSPGYSVSVKYNYDTSWDAPSACRNVAAAFSPAVQELLQQVITNPQFPQLIR